MAGRVEAAVDAVEGTESDSSAGDGLSLRTFSAFAVLAFRLLWINSFSFALSQQIRQFAFVILALDIGSGAVGVAIVSFSLGIPAMFLSLPAGVLADRVDRRLLLFGSQTASMTLTIIAVVVIWADLMTLSFAVALAAMMGAVVAIGQPVRAALVPSLVEPRQLMNAVTLMSFGMNFSMIAGPAVGGAMIGLAGVGGAFTTQAALLFGGLIALVPLRVPPPVQRAKRNVRSDVAEGFRFVVRTSYVRLLFGLLLVTALIANGPFMTLLPQFAIEDLGASPFQASLLFAAMGIGMLMSSLVLASIPYLERAGLWFMMTMVFGGALMFFVGISPYYTLTCALMFFSGINAGLHVNLNQTLVQAYTPKAVMGRVMSIYMLVMMGAAPMGMLIAGMAASVVGAANWYAVCGAGLMIAGIVAVMSQRKVRGMSSMPKVSPEEAAQELAKTP
ncbi:MAG TPA: MFS transporter [Dehalococcoidia bacterium]|nr:MFS transporter [Dehalococcoidia bacterium]